jgi:hypothetical protein
MKEELNKDVETSEKINKNPENKKFLKLNKG